MEIAERTTEEIGKYYAGDPAARTCRIAYLVSQYPAISHTFIFHEINELRALGWDVATASVNSCDRLRSGLPEMERQENDRTFYIKPSGWKGAFYSLCRCLVRHPNKFIRGLLFTGRLGGKNTRYFYFVEALMVGLWMKDRDLSHLHSHFGGAASSVAMIASHTFSTTLSMTIHGPDEFYEVSRNYLARKIAASQFICCIGMFARSQLMRICAVSEWHKLKVVPLGVDPERFRPCAERVVAQVFEVVCVGRLVPAKGQHVLVSAIAHLVREGRSIRLRLLGDGPDRSSLERRICEEGLTENVVLEGAVNQDRVPGFLERADAVALASFAEGIPIALMEAMAMEIPCVSTRIAGIPELIRDEIDGLLVPPSDVEQLTLALRRLMDDARLRRRLGAAGRQRVIEKFDLKKNVARLAEVYRCQLSPS